MCPENESQQHLLECKHLLDKTNISSVVKSVKYDDILAHWKAKAVMVFKELLRTREDLMKT